MFSYHNHPVATISEAPLDNKKVLLRAELNVPLDSSGVIVDDHRIKETLPTINHLRAHNAVVVICSKLGRPHGKFVSGLSLAPVAKRLGALLNKPITMAHDAHGAAVENLISRASGGDVIMLENVRFYPEESKNDSLFARSLAAGIDIYVNDAFGTAHRDQASVTGVPNVVRSYAGFLMEKEVLCLSHVVTPKQPFIAIIGGAKIEDKIGVITAFAKKADKILLGGALANTFLAAQGHAVGRSLYQPDQLNQAKRLLADFGEVLVLPCDVAVCKHNDDECVTKHVVEVDEIADDDKALDIGPKTVAAFKKILTTARTIVWAGPLGYYESPQFAAGTKEVAKHIGSCAAFRVVGGGDTVAVIQEYGLEKNFDHVSTGGGATLDFLANKPMPGLDALIASQKKFNNAPVGS